MGDIVVEGWESFSTHVAGHTRALAEFVAVLEVNVMNSVSSSFNYSRLCCIQAFISITQEVTRKLDSERSFTKRNVMCDWSRVWCVTSLVSERSAQIIIIATHTHLHTFTK